MTTISKLRQPLEDKLWFVGEHTHSYLRALSQGAYMTGKEAAYQIIYGKDEQRIPYPFE